MLFHAHGADHELGKFHEEGSIIFHQGEEAECMYILLEGRVELFIEEENGDEISLDILGKGEIFGTVSLFDQLPRVSSARTIEKSRLLTLDPKVLLQRIGEDPALALRLLGKMATRTRRLIQEVVQLRKSLYAMAPPLPTHDEPDPDSTLPE